MRVSSMKGEQLPLDFSISNAERTRKAKKRKTQALIESNTPELFEEPVNIDIHLNSSTEAIAYVKGDYDRGYIWLYRMVGDLREGTKKSLIFDAKLLDRLLYVRPPALVTLDASCIAIASAIHGSKMELKPILVSKTGKRMIAFTPDSWPKLMKQVDIPWQAIVTLLKMGLNFEVEEKARKTFNQKLNKENIPLAHASLSGSSIYIKTNRPDILERYLIKGLMYDGLASLGKYKLTLLLGEQLLDFPAIVLSDELVKAIARLKIRGKISPEIEGFYRKLYPFQAVDVAKAIKIIENTGGVLLAAEMGAGKTTMSLAIAHKLNIFPVLVVCPLSGYSTWEKEGKMLGRKTWVVKGSNKESWEEITNNYYDIVVISYDKLFTFIEAIKGKAFQLIIADEIQRIRTPSSRRSRSLRQLSASVPYRIGLSGTPLTNSITDLLPLGSFLVPSDWKPRASDKDLKDIYPVDPYLSIAEHLGSMMVRRRMKDVGAKLPKRNDHRIYIDLTSEQIKAISDLEAEVERAKNNKEFDGNSGRMHAFAKLMKLRQIVNNPNILGIKGGNPKALAALDLAESFVNSGRKGVLFCADRTTFVELCNGLKERGIGYVSIWGSTPPQMRIDNEKRFHEDSGIKVVVCTIQAGSESWSASPTATWLISTSYMYAPSMLSQMEARVYRMNSDPDGPEIEITYIHASAGFPTLDDRMLEIIELKKEIFANIIDRNSHQDTTKVHYSMADLTYLLTGEADESIEQRNKKNSKKARQQVVEYDDVDSKLKEETD